MKRLLLLLTFALACVASAQTDHDNIDAGRPLSFDDAEPISYTGLAWEFGFYANLLRNRAWGFGVPVELIWGGALDTQFEIGSTAVFGERSGTVNRRLALHGVDLGVLHSFRREIRNSPALALKFEAELPTKRGEEARYRVRGVLSKTARQYDRLHFNVDADFIPTAPTGDHKVRLGAVLGYTKPLGYFTHFDTTAVAELSVRQGERRGDPLVTGIGLGIRRQVTPRSVLDFGVQSELSGRDRVPLRLIIGYSTSF
ncbi:MAG TPA: hypothetical protein VEX38_06760 [Fimbriimonadaceae bacterium]|nr:hypothetical protein [Fimbriimonadaceae bacterium]